ncbi:hypothetical protein QBC43DRAFT_305873 [Cladorrhinum sp. PSN259]|nr:hypothetical protein QBC43DRAFT_305873 [Cladorrhinum sp. PSN259]
MIIFEDTTSVIEVLWDVAIAFFVVRLAVIYAFLTFGTVLFLSLLPLPPYVAINNVPAPLILILSSAFWARYMIVRYEIPRAAWFRLAIGGVAALLGVVGEGLVRLLVGYNSNGGQVVGLLGELGGLGMVAGMMGLWMVMEDGMGKRRKKGEEEYEEKWGDDEKLPSVNSIPAGVKA